MKRTDIERRNREIKRSQKREEVLSRKIGDSSGLEYAERLNKLFFYDEEKIYNIKQSIEILELLEEMKNDLDEKELDKAIHKAIRLTKIKTKKQAFEEVKSLIE